VLAAAKAEDLVPRRAAERLAAERVRQAMSYRRFSVL
jgi:hypothetical protein